MYFIKDNVIFKVPIEPGAKYDRHLLAQQVQASLRDLQMLKDRSPGLDQMRYEKPGERVVTSTFGMDVVIIKPPAIGVKKPERETTLPDYSGNLIPAIEAYNAIGEFKGLVLCLSGTFNPAYKFVAVANGVLDPFWWGQWKYAMIAGYYGCTGKPYEKRVRKHFYSEHEFSYKKSSSDTNYLDVPNTAEDLVDYMYYDNRVQTGQWLGSQWEEIYCIPGGSGCEATRHDFRNWQFLKYGSVENKLGLVDNEGLVIEGSWFANNLADDISTENWICEGTACHDGAVAGSFGGGKPCAYCISVCAAAPGLNWAPVSYMHWAPEYMPAGEPVFTAGNCWYDGTYYITGVRAGGLRDMACSNIQDLLNGGMVFTPTESQQSGWAHNTNGFEGLSDAEIIYSNPQVDYGVRTTGSSYTSTWKEGAWVNDKFFEYRSGEGDYNAQADRFWRDSPRYWKFGEKKIFMSSSMRWDNSSFCYFHVDYNTEKLTGTEFLYSHYLSSTRGYYHRIPGFTELYGNGQFRLVQVNTQSTRTFKENLDG